MRFALFIASIGEREGGVLAESVVMGIKWYTCYFDLIYILIHDICMLLLLLFLLLHESGCFYFSSSLSVFFLLMNTKIISLEMMSLKVEHVYGIRNRKSVSSRHTGTNGMVFCSKISVFLVRRRVEKRHSKRGHFVVAIVARAEVEWIWMTFQVFFFFSFENMGENDEWAISLLLQMRNIDFFHSRSAFHSLSLDWVAEVYERNEKLCIMGKSGSSQVYYWLNWVEKFFFCCSATLEIRWNHFGLWLFICSIVPSSSLFLLSGHCLSSNIGVELNSFSILFAIVRNLNGKIFSQFSD